MTMLPESEITSRGASPPWLGRTPSCRRERFAFQSQPLSTLTDHPTAALWALVWAPAVNPVTCGLDIPLDLKPPDCIDLCHLNPLPVSDRAFVPVPFELPCSPQATGNGFNQPSPPEWIKRKNQHGISSSYLETNPWSRCPGDDNRGLSHFCVKRRNRASRLICGVNWPELKSTCCDGSKQFENLAYSSTNS